MKRTVVFGGKEILCDVVGEGDGGSIILETPIARLEGTGLKNGPLNFDLTPAMGDQMVQNYSRWLSEGGAPAAGYFGHATTKEDQDLRDKSIVKPALHVLKIWRNGIDLMAHLEFSPAGWAELTADGTMGVRGLSIVFAEEGKDRHGAEIGAVFGGVDITPDPFLPVQIAAAKIAEVMATQIACSNNWYHLSTQWNTNQLVPTGDDPMDVKELQKQLIELQQKLADTNAAHQVAMDAQKTEFEAALAAATEAATVATTAATEATAALKVAKTEMADTALSAQNALARTAIDQALECGALAKADVEGYDAEDSNAAQTALQKLGWFKDAEGLRTYCSKLESNDSRKKVVNTNGRIQAGAPRTKLTQTKPDAKVALSKQHPDATDEQLDAMLAQDAFLVKIDETIELSKKDGTALTYNQATVQASTDHPEEYQAYLESQGISLPRGN